MDIRGPYVSMCSTYLPRLGSLEIKRSGLLEVGCYYFHFVLLLQSWELGLWERELEL